MTVTVYLIQKGRERERIPLLDLLTNGFDTHPNLLEDHFNTTAFRASLFSLVAKISQMFFQRTHAFSSHL